MTNDKELLQAMLARAEGDPDAAPVAAALRYALAAIDFAESCEAEDASTNGDDEMPSLPVYGNVDLDTLVAVGLWEARKQIRFRDEAPTW